MLSGTGGNQPGITGKRPTSNRSGHRPGQAPRQRHDQRSLPHVKPVDGPTDDHAVISEVPSKTVTLVEVRAVSEGRWLASPRHVSTSSATDRILYQPVMAASCA